jgi:predicted O-methyltransferase YrrM
MYRQYIVNYLIEQSSNTKEIVDEISKNMVGKTFHHHYHILYSLADLVDKKNITYLEIGTFNGGSLCLMMSHNKVDKLVSIDPFHLTRTDISIVEQNINKFNTNNKNVILTKKFSHDKTLLNELSQSNFKTDILFIDGDHSYNGVCSDFNNYWQFVENGGFIVFDDYHDKKYSPEVKPAVDDIVKKILDEKLPFIIIGDFANTVLPKSSDNSDLINEFIIMRVDSIDNPPILAFNKKIAVCMATYYRKNGTSKNSLLNAFNYLNNQKYKDFKLFIAGDKYENNEEFIEICKSYKGDIYYENLTESYRDYFTIQHNKWSLGGQEAMYYAAKKAYDEGYDYYFHLDDDDIWTENHISNYVKNLMMFPETDFMLCKSRFMYNKILPRVNIVSVNYNNYTLTSSDSVHASWCINLKTIGLEILNLQRGLLDICEKFKKNIIEEYKIEAADSITLRHFRQLQLKKIIKVICLLDVTCLKHTDGNIPK